jgi:hypothetical protein
MQVVLEPIVEPFQRCMYRHKHAGRKQRDAYGYPLYRVGVLFFALSWGDMKERLERQDSAALFILLGQRQRVLEQVHESTASGSMRPLRRRPTTSRNQLSLH